MKNTKRSSLSITLLIVTLLNCTSLIEVTASSLKEVFHLESEVGNFLTPNTPKAPDADQVGISENLGQPIQPEPQTPGTKDKPKDKLVQFKNKKLSQSLSDSKRVKLDPRQSPSVAPKPDDKDINMNNLIEQPCQMNDNITQQACFEYCTKYSKYDDGKCSRDQQVCVCLNSKDGRSKRVKLYKPKEVAAEDVGAGASLLRKPKLRSKLIVNHKGDFACDNSLESKSICQVFCTTKGSSHSSCALDSKSCLCFKMQPRMKGEKLQNFPARNGRNYMGDEQVIGMGLQRQFPGSGPPFWSPPNQQFAGNTCTPHSCLANCPPRCDNLCTANLQCFCSCPEDSVDYDYFDGGNSDSWFPQFSFFG